MKKVEVLISAMHQKNDDIFFRTNVKSDALLVNQCDANDYREQICEFGSLKTICTTERGLSNSRNMALKNASKDYVLLCDDDEFLYDGYADIIERSFEENPNADILCFQIKRLNRTKPLFIKNKIKIGFIKSLKIASWQIAIKVSSLQKTNIYFDPDFGSGSPVGAGEENIFLYDCLKKGLSILNIPIYIGEVSQKSSMWFKGFTEEYFFNRGRIIKRLFGRMGLVYCLYFILAKYKRYRVTTSMYVAFRNIIVGFFSKI